MGSERAIFPPGKTTFATGEQRTVTQKAAAGNRHAEEHRRQQEELHQLRQQVESLRKAQRSDEEQHPIDELRQANNGLFFGRIDELTSEVDLLREELARGATGSLSELQQVRGQMEQREGDQDREIASMEAMLFRHIATEQDPCAQCADQNTGQLSRS